SQERRTNQIDRGLAARNRFNDDINVAGEEVVEPLGPGDAGERLRLTATLVAGASIGDVCELELGDGIGTGGAPGERRSGWAGTEEAKATAIVAVGRTTTRGLERVQRHARAVIPDGQKPAQEVLSIHLHS